MVILEAGRGDGRGGFLLPCSRPGTRKNAVAQLDVVVRAVSTSAEDHVEAAMVREMLCDGPIQLDSVLSDVLDAVGKGFSATEIMWDTSGRSGFPHS